MIAPRTPQYAIDWRYQRNALIERIAVRWSAILKECVRQTPRQPQILLTALMACAINSAQDDKPGEILSMSATKNPSVPNAPGIRRKKPDGVTQG